MEKNYDKKDNPEHYRDHQSPLSVEKGKFVDSLMEDREIGMTDITSNSYNSLN